MTMKIAKAYVRRYGDTGEIKAYVEWYDSRGTKAGRTEGDVGPCRECGHERERFRDWQLGTHMAALFRRAEAAGVEIETEEW